MREGWRLSRLGDIAEFQNGYPFKPADLGSTGLPVIRIKQLLDPLVEPDRCSVSVPMRHHIDDGDIVFSWSGTLAVRVWARGPALLNQHLFQVSPKEGISRKWLALALDGALSELEEKTHGSTMRHITKGELLPHQVAVPPLTQQRWIVDLMAHVDEQLRALDGVAREADRLLAASEMELVAANKSNRIPLGEVVSFAGGQAFAPRLQGRSDGPYPVYKVSDMNRPGNERALGDSENYLDDAGIAEMKARLWPPGTVVFPKVGAALLTEKRRVLSRLAAFDNNVMGLVPSSALLPGFLLAFMKGIRLGAVAQVGAVPSVNQSHLRALEIPVPSLDEQQEIVEAIEAVQGVGRAAKVEFDALTQVRVALLQDLLSGNHEIPASYDALLESA